MPIQARLDAPGALHHVMGPGIEGTSIFRSAEDREDFLTRLGSLCEGEEPKGAGGEGEEGILSGSGEEVGIHGAVRGVFFGGDDVLGEPDCET